MCLGSHSVGGTGVCEGKGALRPGVGSAPRKTMRRLAHREFLKNTEASPPGP